MIGSETPRVSLYSNGEDGQGLSFFGAVILVRIAWRGNGREEDVELQSMIYRRCEVVMLSAQGR